jgi:hypothetical protein
MIVRILIPAMLAANLVVALPAKAATPMVATAKASLGLCVLTGGVGGTLPPWCRPR